MVELVYILPVFVANCGNEEQKGISEVYILPLVVECDKAVSHSSFNLGQQWTELLFQEF